MLQVVTGSLYLGGFVGTETVQARCMKEKVVGWRYLVSTLDGVARRHLQTTYVILQKSLWQEYAFVQNVTSGIGMAFQPVDDKLQETFLPALFRGATSQIPERAITGRPVKQAEIALTDPSQTDGANWTSSYVITGHFSQRSVAAPRQQSAAALCVMPS